MGRQTKHLAIFLFRILRYHDFVLFAASERVNGSLGKLEWCYSIEKYAYSLTNNFIHK